MILEPRSIYWIRNITKNLRRFANLVNNFYSFTLHVLNCPLGLLFIMNNKLNLGNLIHPHHLDPKSFLLKSKIRSTESTWSYALTKSTLKTVSPSIHFDNLPLPHCQSHRISPTTKVPHLYKIVSSSTFFLIYLSRIKHLFQFEGKNTRNSCLC